MAPPIVVHAPGCAPSHHGAVEEWLQEQSEVAAKEKEQSDHDCAHDEVAQVPSTRLVASPPGTVLGTQLAAPAPDVSGRESGARGRVPPGTRPDRVSADQLGRVRDVIDR